MLADFFFNSHFRESLMNKATPKDEDLEKVKSLADNDYHVRQTISIMSGYYRNKKSFEQQLAKVDVKTTERLWKYYKNIMRIDKWEKSPRYDLKHIPYMLDKNYEVTFHYKDIRSGRTWPDTPCDESVVFDKANDRTVMRMWFVPEKVCVARYTGAGFLEDHKYFTSIEDAVDHIETLLNQ